MHELMIGWYLHIHEIASAWGCVEWVARMVGVVSAILQCRTTHHI